MSVFPVVDLLLWLQWLAGAALVIWLPGHLVGGRRLRGQDALSRSMVSLALGLLLVPVIGGVFSLTGIPLDPWTYLSAAGLLSLVLGRVESIQTLMRAWVEDVRPLDRGEIGIVLASAGLGAVLLGIGFADFVAPPHVHDASNHAFLTRSVVEAKSMDPQALFSRTTGEPTVLYLAGWHAAAALVAEISGVAPYLSTWLLALAAIVLTPLSLTLLWRAWGLPGMVATVAPFFVAANQLAPGGVLGWGGFGQAVGFFLAPILVLAVRAVLRNPSVRQGVLAGLALGAMVPIHASEVTVALLLAIPALAALREEREARSGAAHLRAWGALLLALALFAGPGAWKLAADYAAKTVTTGASPERGVGDALERWLSAGGKAGAMKVLVVLGIAAAMRRPTTRRVGLLALGLGLFYVSVAALRDPVSRLLATPFYQQAPRILYLQIYLLPALMVLPLKWAHDRLRSHVGSAAARGVLVVLTVAAVAPALAGLVTNYRNMAAAVPFSEEAYRLARSTASRVGPGERVANFWDDGSTWAMHVSKREFLLPCSWELADSAGSLRPRVRGLLEEPWPERTRELKDLAVTHLWVSDEAWPRPDAVPGSVAEVAADPRFVMVERRGNAALFRIEWNGELPRP